MFAFQDVGILGVGEIAIGESVLDLGPDPNPSAELRLLDLSCDLLLAESAQQSLLHQRHLLHGRCLLFAPEVCRPKSSQRRLEEDRDNGYRTFLPF